MKVLKFGGTSVANPENIHKVKSIIQGNGKTPQAVFVSAFGGITDKILTASNLASEQDLGYTKVVEEIELRHLSAIKTLIPIKKQSAVLSQVKSDLNTLETLLEGSYLIGEVTPKLSDKIVGYGELLSAYIISEFLKSEGLNVAFKDSRELITTDESFGNAKVDTERTQKNCKAYFASRKESATILPGFIASSHKGNSTTLGRGGSDYSAAILASALQADVLEIWTDVSGMYTANPKMVKQAKCIADLSYEEAMELSHFGAKVLYPPSLTTPCIRCLCRTFRMTR